MTDPIYHLIEGYMPIRGSEVRYSTLCGSECSVAIVETDGRKRCLRCLWFAMRADVLSDAG
jgi:hypothetical protein